jgi:hypothetical protein
MMAMTQRAEVLKLVVSRVTDVVDLEPLDAAAQNALVFPSADPVPADDCLDSGRPVDGPRCRAPLSCGLDAVTWVVLDAPCHG